MKLVREHIILEKFKEESDPIHDLGIGRPVPEPKDFERIMKIYNMYSYDQYGAAAKMAKLITDKEKAFRRYLAAKEIHETWHVGLIFLRRACELGSTWANEEYKKLTGHDFNSPQIHKVGVAKL